MVQKQKNIALTQKNHYKKRLYEPDGIYFFKLITVVIVSSLWLKLDTQISWQTISLNGFPVGAMAVLIAIRLFEKNPYDRRIWFAVSIIITILSYFLPAGIVI